MRMSRRLKVATRERFGTERLPMRPKGLEPKQGFEELLRMSIMEVVALETQLKSRTATLQHVQLLIVFGVLGILGALAVKRVELEPNQGFEELLLMSITEVVALETQ